MKRDSRVIEIKRYNESCFLDDIIFFVLYVRVWCLVSVNIVVYFLFCFFFCLLYDNNYLYNEGGANAKMTHSIVSTDKFGWRKQISSMRSLCHFKQSIKLTDPSNNCALKQFIPGTAKLRKRSLSDSISPRYSRSNH